MATIPIQLKIEEKVFANIKKMARYQAVEKDEDVSWQDLVREAIYNSYPLPKDNSDVNQENVSQCL